MHRAKFWTESPEASFERACAAWDGAFEDFQHFEARKIFTIVAASQGADTTLDRQGFHVLWPHRRELFHYVPGLGPFVVAALRAHAPAGSFDCAFDLDPDVLAQLCLFKHPAPMRFWVRRDEARIVIFCRPASSTNVVLSTPEPLAPWSLPQKVFAVFDPPRCCVHCGVSPNRFRYSENVLICLACGRSQQVKPQELEGATLRTEPMPER